MKLFKRWSSAGVMLAVTALAATLVAGCGGDRSFPTADLRIVHAGSDAPLINVRVNDTPLSMAQGLAFSEVTPLLLVRPKIHSVVIDGVQLDGSVGEFLAPMDLLFNRGNITTLVLMGKIGESTFTLKEVVTPRANLAADSARIQIVHASTNTPADVDVYVTEPGEALTAADATVAWGQASEPWVLAAGKHQIRVTPVGTPSTVIFDSGSIDLLGGADLMLLAVDNYGPSSSMKLLASSTAVQDTVIFDQRAVAELRLVHAASGVGPADVSTSSVILGAAGDFIEANISSRSAVDAEGLPAGNDYIFNISKTGSSDVLFATSALNLKADTYYTAVIAGEVPSSGSSKLAFLLSEDNRRSVANEARLRFIHAASRQEELVLFITKAGEKALVNIEGGDVTPTVTGFKYQSMAPLQRLLSPDSYDIRVARKVVGSNKFEVLINSEGMALSDGDETTLVIANPDPVNGHTGFGFAD